MSNKSQSPSHFRNFPRLQEAAKNSRPSIFSINSSVHNHLKFSPHQQQFEIPRKRTKTEIIHAWALKNPIKFQVIGITLGLSVFYSRQIYDIYNFLRYPNDVIPLVPPPEDN